MHLRSLYTISSNQSDPIDLANAALHFWKFRRLKPIVRCGGLISLRESPPKLTGLTINTDAHGRPRLSSLIWFESVSSDFLYRRSATTLPFFFPLSLSLSLSLGERWVVLLDEFHLSLSLSVSLSLPLTHTHPHIPPHRHSVSVLEDFINKVGPVERNGHQLGAVRRQVRHSESAKADSLCQVVSEGQNLPRSARTDHCIHTHTHTQTHTHTLVWPQIICTSVYRNIPAYLEVSVPPVQYVFISKATQSRNQWQLVSMSSWKIGENESIVLTNQSVSFSKAILLIQG